MDLLPQNDTCIERMVADLNGVHDGSDVWQIGAAGTCAVLASMGFVRNVVLRHSDQKFDVFEGFHLSQFLFCLCRLSFFFPDSSTWQWVLTGASYGFYFTCWFIMLCFWLAVIRMLKHSVTTVDVRVGDISAWEKRVFYVSAAAILILMALPFGQVLSILTTHSANGNANKGHIVNEKTWAWYLIYQVCRTASFTILTVLVVIVGCRLCAAFANVLGGMSKLLRKPRAVASLVPYLLCVFSMLGCPVGFYFTLQIQKNLEGECDLPKVKTANMISTTCSVVALYVPVFVFTLVMWSRPKIYVRRGLSAESLLSQNLLPQPDASIDGASASWHSYAISTGPAAGSTMSIAADSPALSYSTESDGQYHSRPLPYSP